jgi:hypothetical protein
MEATNFRRMVLELDRRLSGLGRQIEESMAAKIDGEIFEDTRLAPPGRSLRARSDRRPDRQDRVAKAGTGYRLEYTRV